MASLQNSFALLVDDDSDSEVPQQSSGNRSNQPKGSFNAERGRGRENTKRTGQREQRGKAPRPGKYDKDRHLSRKGDKGTAGKGAKKGGAGNHNWGTPGDEGDASVDRDDPTANDGNAGAEEDEEDNSITYEEYLAQQAAKKAANEAFQKKAVRKVSSSLSGSISKDADAEEAVMERTDTGKKQKKRNQSQASKKGIMFTDFGTDAGNSGSSGRNGRGRGGSRGGRGGRGRGRGRGGSRDGGRGRGRGREGGRGRGGSRGGRGGRGGFRGERRSNRGGRSGGNANMNSAMDFPSLS